MKRLNLLGEPEVMGTCKYCGQLIEWKHRGKTWRPVEKSGAVHQCTKSPTGKRKEKERREYCTAHPEIKQKAIMRAGRRTELNSYDTAFREAIS